MRLLQKWAELQQQYWIMYEPLIVQKEKLGGRARETLLQEQDPNTSYMVVAATMWLFAASPIIVVVHGSAGLLQVIAGLMHDTQIVQ